MFFKFERRFNLLNIDSTYARLDDVSIEGDLTFEFCYKIKQSDAIQRDALTVRASIISQTVRKRPIIDNSHRGHWNTDSMIGNILRNTQRSKSAIKEKEQYVISTRNSDIGSKINNQLIPRFSAGIFPKDIQDLWHNRLKLKYLHEIKEKNEDKPVLQFAAHSSVMDIEEETSSSIEFDHRACMRDMIIRQGIDPTNIFNLTHRSITSQHSFGGLLRPSRASERSWDPSVRLLHRHIFNYTAKPHVGTTTSITNDQVAVMVLESENSDEVEVPITMVIPHKARRAELRDDKVNFHVKFELIDGRNGVVIDTVVKSLDISRHLQLYYTPRKPPIVTAVGNELTSRVTLDVKQQDPGAESINVYRKIIPKASVVTNDYNLIGNFPLTFKEQSLAISVDKPMESPAIYRVVPVGEQGSEGFEFTNVVVKPNRYRPNKAVALNAKSVDTGVEIEARSFPTEIVSIEFMVRDMTLYEKNYTNVGGVLLVDDQSREANSISTIDPNVQEGHVYEYIVKLIYRSGLTENAGNTVVEYFDSVIGKVDIKVEDVQVDNDESEPNVTFNVRSEILDNDIDIIRSLLKRQDIKEYFENDLQREREFMKDLIAHNIQRVNLTTGQREDFGVISTDVFNDKELRKNNAVSPLRLGEKYRYEVSTLLRSPETLFEEYVKEKVDPTTKKTYSFKPSKFLHPITLREGTIVTPTGLKTRYPKDTFSHGKVGTTEFVEVSFDDNPANVINLEASRFNRTLNVISWKLEGSIDQVDHFVIMKDVHGVRTMIGKAHSEFEFGNVQYLHEISEFDVGELSYIVIPVFNDYEMGDEVRSNSVVV